MKIEEIKGFLNPEKDPNTDFHILAAIEHIQSKTNRKFVDEYGELDFPVDLVQAVRLLVNSADDPTNIQSESIGGEMSVTYFSRGATDGIKGYWLPYRRLSWDGGKNKR